MELIKNQNEYYVHYLVNDDIIIERIDGRTLKVPNSKIHRITQILENLGGYFYMYHTFFDRTQYIKGYKRE